MTQKTISSYSSFDPANLDRQLIVDIGAKCIVCVLKKDDHIEAFEFFELEMTNENDFEDTFYEVRTQSKLLDKGFKDVKVYYNLHEAVIAPVSKFANTNSGELLDLVYGDKLKTKVFQERVNDEMINVYRIHEQWKDVIHRNFISFNEKHIYTELIEQALQTDSEASHQILLFFYKDEMIIVATIKKQLQHIQKFNYHNAADALYHLLNACKQLNFPVELTDLRVSGMMQRESEIYKQMERYFPKMSVVNVDNTLDELSQYPQHYFTPYFRLGV